MHGSNFVYSALRILRNPFLRILQAGTFIMIPLVESREVKIGTWRNNVAF
jgi:hypothetical protein